jgi:uncharacterized oligopeptide transporter (OPT) family protein
MNRFSIRSLAYACHAVFWCVVILTIAAEQVPVVKEFLAGLSGHHWTSKSIIAMVLFVAVASLFSRRKDPEDVLNLVKGVIVSGLAAALVIFVFYLLH